MIDQCREFQVELLSALQQRLPPELVAEPEAADVLVSPALVVLDVDQKKKDRIYLQARAELIFSWTNDAGEQYLGKRASESPSSTMAGYSSFGRMRQLR